MFDNVSVVQPSNYPKRAFRTGQVQLKNIGWNYCFCYLTCMK